jgi:hypothetical protein
VGGCEVVEVVETGEDSVYGSPFSVLDNPPLLIHTLLRVL